MDANHSTLSAPTWASNGKAAILGDRQRKPTTRPVDPSTIHDGLKLQDRWLTSRWTWNPKANGGRGKYDKPPLNARTGGPGSSTDYRTWSRFEDAISAQREGRADMIGFALGEADGGLYYSGIDLDDCRNPDTGEITPLATDIISTMDSYAEVSPSGTGVKIICLGKLPVGSRSKNKAGTVEIYGGGRYFALTGQRVEGTPKRVELRQDQLMGVYSKYIGSEQQQRPTTTPTTNGEAVGDCLAAMLKIEPEGAENDGSSRKIKVARQAVRYGLSDVEAVATFRAYEARHPFPRDWSDTEIIQAVRDTETRVTRGEALARRAYYLSDVGNGERFAAQHGADLRFCHVWGKWLFWDGRRWSLDTTGEVMRRAKRTARSIYAEAAETPDKDRRESLARWAATSERRERLTAMIALAESEEPIPIAVESLDSDAWLLNVENGTLELRTGELREHRRDDYLTKCCPVEYPTEPGDDPELWLSFLDRIFDSRQPLIDFVQRLMGASLVGEVLEHVLPIYYGPGSNGKSVKIETWAGMLGPDYAMKAPPGLLMVSRSDRHPTELADLHGKRLVAAMETADGGRLSEALVKELTGGDSVRARRMREDFWQFRPSHTVVLATNHKPTIRGTDFGIWRRIRLVPFTVTIPEAEQDRELTSKLRAEWPAILRWAVAGCLDWQRNGLQAPGDVLVATETYRADQDVLGEWLQDRCITGNSYTARASDLYHAYKDWATGRGEYVESQTRFGTRLAERGFGKDRDSGNRVVYRGIGLVAPDSPDSSDGFFV